MATPPHTRAEMRVFYPVFRWWELAAGWRDTTGQPGAGGVLKVELSHTWKATTSCFKRGKLSRYAVNSTFRTLPLRGRWPHARLRLLAGDPDAYLHRMNRRRSMSSSLGSLGSSGVVISHQNNRLQHMPECEATQNQPLTRGIEGVNLCKSP